MNVRPLIAATMLFGAVAAHAAFAPPVHVPVYGTYETDAFTVTYDTLSPSAFGVPSYSFSGGSGLTGFSWSLPGAIGLTGSGLSQIFELPDFTITAKSGWSLSGPFTAFLGNLTFSEFAGANTSATVSGSVSLNGGAASSMGGPMDKVASVTFPSTGYFTATGTSNLPTFTTLSVSGATLTLNLGSSGFASIVSQPQNELKFSMIATPVPEPESYAMMLVGLLAVGTIIRRRQKKA